MKKSTYINSTFDWKMPCVQCKNDFTPYSSLLSKEPEDTFYFCRECLAIIQPERSKREDVEKRSGTLNSDRKTERQAEKTCPPSCDIMSQVGQQVTD